MKTKWEEDILRRPEGHCRTIIIGLLGPYYYPILLRPEINKLLMMIMMMDNHHLRS